MARLSHLSDADLSHSSQLPDMDLRQEPTGHRAIRERKATGAHYTPSTLAGFVAKNLVGAWPEGAKRTDLSILDPASGDGELLLSALTELSHHGFSDFRAYGFDTDPSAVEFTAERLRNAFPLVPISIEDESFIEFVLWNASGDLFSNPERANFDLVIANPPYVRTQVLGAKRAQSLAKQFGLTGRVDLYHAFILGISRVLRPGGLACIIVSNRFMSTKAGEQVRRGILEIFDVLHVWDLGDTRLFEAAVLPAVLLLRRKDERSPTGHPRFTSIYSTNESSPAQEINDAIEALGTGGLVQLKDGSRFYVRHGELHHGEDPGGLWRLTNADVASWLKTVASHTHSRFGDIGKIRVGVKTNADKIFIRSDWEDLEGDMQPELLLPLITHHIARRFKSHPVLPEKKVLYPHEIMRGKRRAVELSQYPKSEKYLLRYKEILEGREYLMKGGRKWYEIWVPQNPDNWALPKLVFRDIAAEPTFWVDLTGSVVNGDCYWLAFEDQDRLDLLWLTLAVGNSSFIVEFYDRMFNNKLYASRRRFMTQYVEQFPLPDPKTPTAKKIISEAQKIYKQLPSASTEIQEANVDQLVWQAFGLPFEEVGR